MQQFDVVIAGGGLIGLTLANCLARTCPQLQLGVIEANAMAQHYHPSFDDRSIALAADSAAYLQQAALFDASASFASAIKTVQVSDKGHLGKTTLSHSEYQLDALGYVVQVKPFGLFLQQQLPKNVSQFCPDHITDIQAKTTGYTLSLAQGEQLSTRLLIVADGANSQTRAQLGIEFDTTAYSQYGLIANIATQAPHQGQAFERFTQHGPIALLPLTEQRYSLVWCDEPTRLQKLLALNEGEFLAQLQQEFGYRAGLFTQVGQRHVYPLQLGKAAQLMAYHSVVIGNAAHAVHPIAGQGFNLGLRDIKALVNLCAQTPVEQLGNYAFTRAYQQQRCDDIQRVTTLTDALVRLFSNSSRTIALGRTLGLTSLNLCSTIKRPLAQQLMGFN